MLKDCVIYHFAFIVESYGDPVALCAQLKIDVILFFTRFECHKIVAGTTGWTAIGLKVAAFLVATFGSEELDEIKTNIRL